ncbi:hypothetical protein [uncultured Psychroserpens sp.]|uniref:hypothetical protein n=1 Tax=uncultured Psychroserpens sp. TaxID=255436 RepID=UPI002628713F|nr:hypothetical protein [uncultured Psychroserpens sp.]
MIKLNRKYLVVFITMLFTCIGFTQEEEVKNEVEVEKKLDILFNSVIEMDIDKTIFTLSEGNSHFTENQKSGIVAMLAPSSFEKIEKELANEITQDKGSEILDKGELKNDGKRILFLKQSMEREGQIYYMLMFAKELNDEFTIMVTAIYESSKDATFKTYAEKAVRSAKIIEKE